jgi:hypothetical protein
MKRPEVKIVIPDVLKLQLVDDWEYVTKNHQVSMDGWDRESVRCSFLSWCLFLGIPTSERY